jgi:membrane protein YdbS with pleckstrin-like domain
MSENDLSNAAEKGKMLPGIAAISLYLTVFTLATIVFALTSQAQTTSVARYGVLALYTLLAVGLFGQLRMRRWGWAIVLAGCLLLSATFFYAFKTEHHGPSLIQGLFMLLFFLYLVRPEVRDRMI